MQNNEKYNKYLEKSVVKGEYRKYYTAQGLSAKWIIILCVLAALAISFITSTIVLATANSQKNKRAQNRYDFYITLGTMPTLYATINAYQNQNPNTYMWFERGNTISYEYSAPFIHYLSGQAQDNRKSQPNFLDMRATVRNILKKDPSAKFHLFCDDLRVRFILDIFVAAGVEFDTLDVTFLSDGTLSYNVYNQITENDYLTFAKRWTNYLNLYIKNRSNYTYVAPDIPLSFHAMELQEFAPYLSTFSNINYWIQYPEYLVNTQAPSLQKSKLNMNIIQKSPKAMYDSLNEQIRHDYQRVVLANTLVDNNTLNTLDDAVKYFDDRLQKTDKEVVLLLGTNKASLAENTPYLQKTLAFYIPTLQSGNQILYKGKSYTTADNSTIVVDGKTLKIGELGVYLYFKPHPAFTPDNSLKNFLNQHKIETLPLKTPAEVLFWMYDVKVGGYQSTAYLSCKKGQVEFIYLENAQKDPIQWKDKATELLYEQGFFADTKFIYNDPI